MNARAGIVVTGTEVLTGRVSDRNGPWLAEQLRQTGVDIAQIVVVGDRPDDLAAACEFLAGAGVDLIITSGGLGPTADDLTAAVVADVQGRPLRLDPALATSIGAIIQRLNARRGRTDLDPAATAAGVQKQALVPDGAAVLAPTGTAPGLVVPVADGRTGPPVVVLPGPPGELQAMWPLALTDPLVQVAIAGRVEIRQRTMRLWQTPESELAATLRAHDAELTGLEITTCLRDGELEIVTRFAPDAEFAYGQLQAAVQADFAAALFSLDGLEVDELIAAELIQRNWRLGTAESCTGGLLSARLTARPGSSAYFVGGVSAYDNTVKRDLLGVPATVIDRFGAVSAEVAAAMADGVRTRLASEVGVAITGVAGPDGGTPDKPVGRVELAVVTPDGTSVRQVQLSGSRSDIRQRAVVAALHLLRTTLDR